MIHFQDLSDIPEEPKPDPVMQPLGWEEKEDILSYFQHHEVFPDPQEGHWPTLLAMSAQLGMGVRFCSTMQDAFIGDAPAGQWYDGKDAWFGPCRVHDEAFLQGADADFFGWESAPRLRKGEDDLLHELCHLIVAKDEDRSKVNFDSDIDEEVQACDCQLAWLTMAADPEYVMNRAADLNYFDCDYTVGYTFVVAIPFWEAAGFPIGTEEELSAKLCDWLGCEPSTSWSDALGIYMQRNPNARGF